MNHTILKSIIKGNLEAVDQGVELINKLSDEQYQHIAVPYVRSSIGEHFRHLVDLYLALMNEQSVGVCDYDVRRRGADIEVSRATALAELANIKSWLTTLESENNQFFNRVINVNTEVTLLETESVTIKSSVLRELIFTSSHAVHHFAVIGVVAKIQGIEVNGDLGIAPATATFLRESEDVFEETACAQ